tara:strand:- start:3630 stop:3905 length:276 start_codon:yes stop_codon:yes gene_type:complete
VLAAAGWVAIVLKQIIGLVGNGTVDMDPIYIVEKVLRELRQRKQDLTELLVTGAVKNWEGYQKILGELSGLSSAERIIIDLQNIKEQEDVS